MTESAVTVVVGPHERFSVAGRALDALLAHTPASIPILYVDGHSPRAVRRLLDRRSRERGFRIIRSARYLSPNAARNLALPHVATRYVVFLGNDVLVHPGWLEPLVRCAEETGAWLVAPLYLMGEGAAQVIHMAGGVSHIREEGGRRSLYEKDYHAGARLADLPAPLARREVELVDLHGLLARMDVFARLGPFDEALQNVREHDDLCLAVRQAGGTIWLEPRSVVTYLPIPPVTPSDLPYFLRHWSRPRIEASLARFHAKWRLDMTADDPHYDDLWTRRRWVVWQHTRRLRRLLRRPASRG